MDAEHVRAREQHTFSRGDRRFPPELEGAGSALDIDGENKVVVAVGQKRCGAVQAEADSGGNDERQSRPAAQDGGLGKMRIGQGLELRVDDMAAEQLAPPRHALARKHLVGREPKRRATLCRCHVGISRSARPLRSHEPIWAGRGLLLTDIAESDRWALRLPHLTSGCPHPARKTLRNA